MKPILQRLILGGAVIGLIAGASSAAVTLTEDSYTTPPDQSTPVYIMENQWIRVIIGKGDTSYTVDGAPQTDSTARGTVIVLNDKTGQVPNESQLAVPNTSATKPHVGNNGGYSAYRDRMDAKDPVWSSVVVTGSVDPGNTVATVTVDQDELSAGFHVVKTYTLRDNEKWLQVNWAWQNNNVVDYARPDGSASSAIESIIYSVPGGSKDANDISFAMVKDNSGTGAVAGLNATVGNQWYGGGGTPLAPEMAQGWLAIVDPANTSVLANTWDLAAQQAADNGVAKTRGGVFGNRFTFEVLYQNIAANSTLNFQQNLIVDNGLNQITYAKEGQLLASVETEDAYNLESTATATFKLNSLNPTSAVTYDIKNIHVEDRNTGQTVSGITIPDITGVNVASNAHVTAGARQFTPRAPGFVEGTSYVVKGDLYDGTTLVSTLSSRPFQIHAADSSVFLYQDSATGDYVLENQVYRAIIDDQSGQVNFFYLKDPATGELIRNQTVTSTPPYPMFRDFMQPSGPQVPFGNYTATMNPNGTDTGTSKSLKFDAIANDGTGLLAKTYSLDSMSRSLKVNFSLMVLGDINGGGFYSEVPMAPDGHAGSADRFSAHTADGLLLTHPAPGTFPTTEYWMGSKNDNGSIVAGDQAELDQPWMAMRDSQITDALAVSWNRADQQTYSPLLNGSKVTMNSFYLQSNYNQFPRVHFTNIPVSTTLDTDMYLMCDTGFGAVSYAEANRVLAGIWANNSDNPAGAAFNGTAALTNTSTGDKTFALKNIRILDSTGAATAAGPDITGIAVAAAAQADPAITFTIPQDQAQGAYTLAADLYDGETMVTTLLSTQFNVTAPVAGPTGDLNGDSKVDDADVQIALKLAGGITTATSGDITNGDLDGDGAITALDATAIAIKAQAG